METSPYLANIHYYTDLPSGSMEVSGSFYGKGYHFTTTVPNVVVTANTVTAAAISGQWVAIDVLFSVAHQPSYCIRAAGDSSDIPDINPSGGEHKPGQVSTLYIGNRDHVQSTLVTQGITSGTGVVSGGLFWITDLGGGLWVSQPCPQYPSYSILSPLTSGSVQRLHAIATNSQSVPPSATIPDDETVVEFHIENDDLDYDELDMLGADAAHKVTIPTVGLYLVCTSVLFAYSTDDFPRSVAIKYAVPSDPSTILEAGRTVESVNYTRTVNCTALVQITEANTLVWVTAWNGSDTSVTINGTEANRSHSSLSIHRVGGT